MAEPAAPALARLKRAYPRQKLDADNVASYLAELRDIDPRLLDEAVSVLIRSEEWFPSIAKIREWCAELALALPTEAMAASSVDARASWARERRGPSPPLHPLAGEALAVVGGLGVWRHADEPTVVRAQFGRAYRELRAAAILKAQVTAAPALGPGSAAAIPSSTPADSPTVYPAT